MQQNLQLKSFIKLNLQLKTFIKQKLQLKKFKNERQQKNHNLPTLFSCYANQTIIFRPNFHIGFCTTNTTLTFLICNAHFNALYLFVLFFIFLLHFALLFILHYCTDVMYSYFQTDDDDDDEWVGTYFYPLKEGCVGSLIFRARFIASIQLSVDAKYVLTYSGYQVYFFLSFSQNIFVVG